MKGVVRPPAYIELSRWTMLHNLKDCNLAIVTPDNVEMYLPGVTNLIKDIQIDVLGRADRFKRRFKSDSRKNLAVKTDVIRALLLQKYGGLYIDADAIVFKDLTYYFDLIAEKGFAGVKRSSEGKDHMSVNFYGSERNGLLINEYVKAIKKILSERSEFAYNDLGGQLLTSVYVNNSANATIVEEKEVQPVTFEHARSVFPSTEIEVDARLEDDQKIMMLFNGPFHNELKDLSIDELYYSNTFVGKCFRRALPESIFSDFYDSYKNY
jgi:hypothetical protein